MFWIVCDPSSGSMELCLTEITRSGSQIFVVCLVGVFVSVIFEPVVCVCVCVCVRARVPTDSSSQPVAPYTLRVILVKHSSVVPDVGSHTIRNM